MRNQYAPTAQHCGLAIDCRALTLAGEFYQLDEDELLSFSKDIISFLDENLPEQQFVSQYRVNNSRYTSPKNAAKKLVVSNELTPNLCLMVDACAKCERVSDVRSFRKYLQDLQRGTYENTTDPLRHYVKDFLEQWKDTVPDRNTDPEQLKRFILNIFNEENRIPVKSFLFPDVGALLIANQHQCVKGRYTGFFCINFSAFCLGENVCYFSELLCALAHHMSDKYININARIMLQPIVSSRGRSPYSRYFGRNGNFDDEQPNEGFTEKEWIEVSYLPGVEWMNIVSPTGRTRIPTIAKETLLAIIDEMPDGRLLVQSKKPIDAYGVEDAKILKRYLYAGLYPGNSSFWISKLCSFYPNGLPLSMLPREDWEIVPIFDEEVDIVSTYLVFSHL